MSESGGQVVIQATDKILERFKVDRDEGLEALVEYANADSDINDDCDVFFEELTITRNSGCFEFENEYWPQTVKRLAKNSQRIGIYLRCGNEYGGSYFFAKNPQGESFSFFAGGLEDDFEIEGGDVVTQDNFNKWLAVIPDSIKIDFPKFVGISME